MKNREDLYKRKAMVAELMARSLRPFDGPSIIGAVEFRREQFGLNDSEMAQVLGMAKTHYSDFKAGRRNLPIPAMVRAFALGVPAECLFQIDPKDTPL